MGMQDFFGRAQVTPERVVLMIAGPDRHCRAGELAQQARQMAQWLASQGLQAGERFAVLLENRVEILALVLAAREAGLYAAVPSTHLSADEVAYIVADSGARLVIASRQTLPQLGTPTALPCWTVDQATARVPSLHTALAQLEGPPVDFADRPLGRDLLYSSGTTGRPKGVLKALWPATLRGQTDPEALGTARMMAMDEDTVYLSPAPLYHAAPLRYSLRVLELGRRVVVMERFDAEQALALIERHRVTHSQWVPTMFSSHERRQRPGSVGRATTGRLHIVDDDGQEVPAGVIGQVYFEGGGSFSYLNDPEKTRLAIDARGWVSYGDIGHVDAEGHLLLSDRSADLILAGGVNLYTPAQAAVSRPAAVRPGPA